MILTLTQVNTRTELLMTLMPTPTIPPVAMVILMVGKRALPLPLPQVLPQVPPLILILILTLTLTLTCPTFRYATVLHRTSTSGVVPAIQGPQVAIPIPIPVQGPQVAILERRMKLPNSTSHTACRVLSLSIRMKLPNRTSHTACRSLSLSLGPSLNPSTLAPDALPLSTSYTAPVIGCLHRGVHVQR